MSEYLKQTKGKFKLAGFVNGTTRKEFVSSMTFDSGRTKNECRFGVKTSKNNESWVKVEGFDAEEATFNRWDSKEKKNYVKKVPWSKRNEFQEEGYNPMFGINLSVEENADGKMQRETVFPYDAPDVLEMALQDGEAVYIEGTLDFSSYTKDGEVKKYKNLKPTRIMKSTKEIDFESEDFSELNLFEQELVFLGIEKDPNNQSRFILDAYIIGYKNSVERVEFIVDNPKLASKLKKGLKPYQSIKVLGRLVNSVQEELVEDTSDAWGEDEAEFNVANKPVDREFVITKAYPDTIDKESYSEEAIQNILKADDDFGSTGWDDDSFDDDDDDAWD